MASKVTIGTDPEAFLYNTELQKIVPACGLIGGTKKAPKQIRKDLAKGYTIQEDNVLVEFNIPPCRSIDQWLVAIQTVNDEVRNYVANLGPYELRFVSQHKFTQKALDSDQAMEFGCSKDFNAYAEGGEFPVVDPKDIGQIRVAGGHIHVGFDTAAVPHFVAAAFADLFIGKPMIGLDKQDKRRELYGQPGRYRPTAYGIEYRTPSNWWLTSPDYWFQTGNAAFYFGNYLSNTPTNKIRSAYQKIPWGALRQAITTNDQMLSAQIESYIDAENILGEE